MDCRFDGEEGEGRISELFGPRDSLLVYSYMSGPRRTNPCPMCMGFLSAVSLRMPAIRANM